MEHQGRRRIQPSDVLLRYLRRQWSQYRWTVQTCCGITLFAVCTAAGIPFIFQPKHARVNMRAAHQTVTAFGVVQGAIARGVGSPFDGKVVKVSVTPGEEVKKGDVLFELDTTSIRRELQAARMNLQAAREELRHVQSERQTEMAQYDRQLHALAKDLQNLRLPSPQVLSPSVILAGEAHYTLPAHHDEPDPYLLDYEWQALQAEHQALRSERQARAEMWNTAINTAREHVRRAELRVQQLQARVDGSVRRSPLNGVVTRIRVKPGQHVRAKAPVVRVDDPRGYRVVLKVDSHAREQLAPDTQVELRHGEGAQSGGLLMIVNGWDKDLFYHWVWIKPERPKSLRPGQRVEVAIPPPELQLAAH